MEVGLPIIGCCCPACGDLSLQRQRVKRLIMELEREHPNVKGSMIKALANVMPRHLLDRRVNPVPALREAAAAALPDVADLPSDVPLIPLLTRSQLAVHNAQLPIMARTAKPEGGK